MIPTTMVLNLMEWDLVAYFCGLVISPALEKENVFYGKTTLCSSPQGPLFSISIARLQGFCPASDHGNVAC